MNIPLLDLKAQHEPISQEIFGAIERVVRSQEIILGPEVSELEKRIAAYCQTGYAIAVSSGTDALLVSLMGLEIGRGDEVITTVYSFFATAGAIVRVGAKPVFVDIDPLTYNIDAAKLEAVVTPKTKAIIPVHLYGQCAEMEPILAIARRHGLAVIEDAAQAIGAEYKDGRRAGSMGTVGCLSFFPSKNLGALGDGGMVVTKEESLSERIKILRVHGGKPKYFHKMVGGNFRMDTVQAAVLNVKLNYLEEWTKQRQENARRYALLFEKTPLNVVAQLRLPDAVYANSGVANYHVYNQFVIRVQGRDSLREYLKREAIGTEVYYPLPLHRQECFRYLAYGEDDFPEAARASKETLALPIYPELTRAMQAEVVARIEKSYGSRPITRGALNMISPGSRSA